MEKNIKFLVIIIMWLITTTAFAQYKTEVEDGIFVTFPNKPLCDIVSNKLSYVTTIENDIYMVIVLTDAIPNYSELFLAEKDWTELEKKEVRNAFLNSFLEGYAGTNENSIEVKIGNYYGKKLTYSGINLITKDKSKNFCVALSVRDKMILFECILSHELSTTIREKDNFLNSISTY